MDNIPEREQPKPERTISLGEEFQLFDPKHVRIKRWKGDELDTFKCKLLLNIEDNFQIPLTVDANTLDEVEEKGLFLLPFGPREDGYHIDNADFDVKARREKLERLHEELQKPLDVTKNPLSLVIDSDEDELNNLGLNIDVVDKNRRRQGQSFEFPDKMLDLFKRLRITIETPEGKYEAMPSPDYFSTGRMILHTFYPADLGPLATDDPIKLETGFLLALPSDPEKLSQIRARFVLAEEQPEEAQA